MPKPKTSLSNVGSTLLYWLGIISSGALKRASRQVLALKPSIFIIRDMSKSLTCAVPLSEIKMLSWWVKTKPKS